MINAAQAKDPDKAIKGLKKSITAEQQTVKKTPWWKRT